MAGVAGTGGLEIRRMSAQLSRVLLFVIRGRAPANASGATRVERASG